MVDAISSSAFSAASLLDTVKGKTAPVAPAKPTAPVSSFDATSQAQSSQFPNDIVSVLQDINSKTQQSGGIADLIGGNFNTSTPDPLAGVYNALSQSKFNIAPQQQSQGTPPTTANDGDGDGADGADGVDNNPVQSAITSLHAGVNAYNKVLQQNAQAVLDAGKGLVA